jgi:hypothetical protein
LPELIALYEDHAEHRDKFEVFAIHDESVKSFDELDKKLTSIRKQYWQGKDLPFPVLLDAAEKTEKLYGIRAWPTGLLIDPSGKLVGEAGVSELEAKLPRLSAWKTWVRHRDMAKNIFWSFEPDEYTLGKFANQVKRWTNCEVDVDADAVKACGLTSDGPLPGALFGVEITLRSVEELLLAPHGLGVEPAADGNKLVITKRSGTKLAESYFQKLRGKDLTDRLDRGTGSTAGKEAKPLDIKDQLLIEAVKLVGREFDLPVGLDAKAMRAKILDPMAKVSGSIVPGDLRKSLITMLNPLGLTVEVRNEVVLVTPRSR